jgi:hypothetical protein
MAYSISIDSANRRATIVLRGTVSARTLYRALFDCIARDNWMPGFSLVWDARPIRKRVASSVAGEHLIQSVSDLSLLIGSGRSAIVVRARQDAVVARRLIGRLPSSSRARDVFTSATAAERWLNGARARTRQRI